ncbi:hypothetical protein YH65_04110 [Sulfurovum lithotrophicum]|uniref:HNH endonuclease n=1 Tax=Sulfurovum lithotrophicum TaxID=206403 RepID=A0A7U4RQ96_9BACT|nr:hypothetical protein [Sulfurovum lithotrophicum]AKF24658.1 hypothetical protein YH65_04110 [Sulfurovum lithotrophicum]
MTKTQKYLEALKTFDDWVIVSSWAVRVGELYPDILDAANEQAANQANDTTGLRELAARISSRLSTGGFPEVEIDDSEHPRKVRYISEAQKEERIEGFESIAKQLNKFFSLDFEVDHAFALLNSSEAGKHHPDNLQLLIKAHNGKKNKKNWQRFTIEEQKEYIKQVIALQTMIASRLEISLVDDVLDSLLERLGKVY